MTLEHVLEEGGPTETEALCKVVELPVDRQTLCHKNSSWAGRSRKMKPELEHHLIVSRSEVRLVKSAATVWYRCSGFFAKHRRTIRAMPAGTVSGSAAGQP